MAVLTGTYGYSAKKQEFMVNKKKEIYEANLSSFSGWILHFLHLYLLFSFPSSFSCVLY